MRSFGLWYIEAKEGKTPVNDNLKTDHKPKFSVHINFWSDSVRRGKSNPDLDIGIKIENFRSIDKVVFHCPFLVRNIDINDLSTKLRKVENADLIFNTNGSIQDQDPYSMYTFKKDTKEGTIEEKMVFFPLKQAIGTMFELGEDKDNRKTDITFDLSQFNAILNTKSDYNDVDEVYIRFRISTSEMEKNIYYDCEPSNKSFESVFSGTRIFDFKINEKRNLNPKTITLIDITEGYWFADIDNIHLLVMEPSSYDIESFTNVPMTCRELEEKLWDDYYTNNIDYSKGRVLAYHWSFGKQSAYSCLLKIRYSKTNHWILTAYIFMIVALGIIGSTVVSICQTMYVNFFPQNALLFFVFLFGMGYLIGRK